MENKLSKRFLFGGTVQADTPIQQGSSFKDQILEHLWYDGACLRDTNKDVLGRLFLYSKTTQNWVKNPEDPVKSKFQSSITGIVEPLIWISTFITGISPANILILNKSMEGKMDNMKILVWKLPSS